MAQNKGYLTAGNSRSSDETLTLKYAVKPIVKYLKEKGYKRILCPFSLYHSKYVEVLQENGFEVIYNDGEMDFFNLTKEDMKQWNIDCIVDNPPYSIKDEVIKRLYELEVPFGVLLPQNSLQGKFRTSLYVKHGLEYLGFDSRICFYTKSKNIYYTGETKSFQKEYDWKPSDFIKVGESVSFATGYFCHNVLPEKLIFEKLERKIEPYCKEEDIEEVIKSLNENEERWL